VAVPSPPEKLCNTAQVIVRATAVKYLREPEEVALPNLSYTKAGEIQFKIEEVLKGKSTAPMLSISGFLTDQDDFNDGPVPYRWGRPGTKGGCTTEWYKQGADFLLFLVERDGKFIVYGAPLSAVNEQLKSADDPWLLWVRDYLRGERKTVPEEVQNIRPFRLSLNGWLSFTRAGAI
jgi:hypothetical protein